ncbi:SDR family oxidoreductase [Shewanella sp. 202IG2-18]|uniref:SDR family NAD(P)-dependent oxidoreductase n=1 Tax=Parashewanella hymeniacidonis TaxID=2807618 RepID=UPI0019607704|nr:SDR family oxidoreductase [Parashewanella hymeniacidonis]MBM7071875.1 SDR family oxidoreductase [Parashewanella hymeniacidonis]
MEKTLLITGATRGIGLAILKLFLSKGYYVVGTYYRKQEIAQKLVAEYGSHRLEFHQLFQGNQHSHQQLISQLGRKIDVLINNAGLGSKTVEQVSKNQFEQDQALLHVNALGPLWLCQALIPSMLERGGKIINVASVGGGITHFPSFRLADGMSKAAVTYMTKQLASEHVHSKIDIFAICPGATNTDMFNASTLASLSYEERVQFIANLAKKRLIEPSEIANLCLFLASEQSQILHGAIIDASMGLGVAPELVSKRENTT